MRILGRAPSLYLVDAGSCNGCVSETLALCSSVYTKSKIDIEWVSTPRHADLLVVMGGVTSSLLEPLRQAYEQAPHPKIVVAIGSLGGSGGILEGSSQLLGPIRDFVPVIVEVPGCPPRPQEILEGILHALTLYEQS